MQRLLTNGYFASWETDVAIHACRIGNGTGGGEGESYQSPPIFHLPSTVREENFGTL